MRHRVLLILSLVLLLVPGLVLGANTHGTSSVDAEVRATLGDMFTPHLVPGTCLPAVPGSGLTFSAFACKGYVRGSAADLVYVTQTSKIIGPLNAGNGTYWLAIHRDTSSTVSGWTRQTASHYLWKLASTQPADPTGGLVFQQVTVSGGNITAVYGVAFAGPVGAVYRTQFVQTWATSGDGTAARPWDGWQDKLPWGASYMDYQFPSGYYAVSGAAPIVVTGQNITLRGTVNTVIKFTPTAHDQAAITLGVTPTANSGQNKIYLVDAISCISADTTYRKDCYRLLDVSSVTIQHVRMFENTWVGGGASSAVHIEGREIIDIVKCTLTGDQPLWLGGATQSPPFSANQHNLDKVTIKDSFLLADGVVAPVIYVDPQTYVFQLDIIGNVLQRGSDMFYAADMTTTISWNFVLFRNNRWENAILNPAGHCINIGFSSGQVLYSLHIDGLWCEGSDTAYGVKLRNVRNAVINNYNFTGRGHNSPNYGLSIGDSVLNDVALPVILIGSTIASNVAVEKHSSQLVTLTGGPTSGGDDGVTGSGPAFTIWDVPSSTTPTAWSPALSCSTGTNGHTYHANNNGSYSVHGFGKDKVVHVSGTLILATKDGGCGGFARISLPFTMRSGFPYGSMALGFVSGVTHQASYTSWAAYIDGATALLTLVEEGSNLHAQLPASAVSGTATISFSGTYFIP